MRSLIFAVVAAAALSCSSAFAPTWRPVRASTRTSAAAGDAAAGDFCDAKQIEVCVSTYGKICRRRGSRKTLAWFQELAEGSGVEIIEQEGEL